jgi:ribosomal protein S18 acetylase RimI-like enzyme
VVTLLPEHNASGLRLVAVSLDHPDVQMLNRELQAEYVTIYGGSDDTPIDPAEFLPPSGAFYVGYVSDQPVVMGGWRFRNLVVMGDSRPAEIKKMFVAPAQRGYGWSRRLLAFLEDSASAAGAHSIILETGRPQHAAVGLYTSAGYQPVERFGHYAEAPHTLYFGKVLASN